MVRAVVILIAVRLVCAAQDLDGKLQKMLGNIGHAASLAWSKDGFLIVADTPGGHLRKIDIKGTTRIHEGVHAAGVFIDNDGRLWVADSRARQVVRIDKKGRSEVLAAAYEGKRFNGPSDIVVTRNGHAFFIDPAWARADRSRDLPFYGIFHLPSKGELTAAVRLQARPAGIALSPDGKTLYATVADTRSIIAWNVARNGELTGERVFARDLDGVPDGISTRPDGGLCVAARKLLLFDPDGKQTGIVHVPEKPTDCAFTDDGSTLFIAAGPAVYSWRKAGDDAEGAAN